VFEHGETPNFVAPMLPQEIWQMKKLITITAMLMLVTSTANAGSWFKVDRPCGSGSSSKCVAPRPILRPVPVWSVVGGVKFRELKDPDYQSRTVITSDYGTSVYTYRSYSR
jgi:hypothetical protein